MTEKKHHLGLDIKVTETFYDEAQTQVHTVYYENELGYAQQWVYYEDGILQSVINYKNGKLHGDRYEYYPTGELKEYAEYINGLLDGRMQRFDIQGCLREECDYLNGQKHGCYISYFSNHRIQKLYIYTHDQPDGQCTEKYENGCLKEQHFYKKGIPHQKSEFFNEEGVLVRKILYHNGMRLYEEYLDKKGQRRIHFYEPSHLNSSSDNKIPPFICRSNQEHDI